jgi:hypothetical protein
MYLGAALLVLAVFSFDALAVDGEGGRWFQVQNRIRIEFDDNVNLTEEDEQDSFKIIEDLEFFVNLNLEQTFLSVRYRPSFTWWEDRDDETDLHHDVDFILNHSFTPRLSLSVKETFRLAQLAELIDRGTTLREEGDYIYNSLNGTLAYLFTPETRLDILGRYVLLQYDEDIVGELFDYDILVAGANLRRQVLPETAVQGEIRFEQIEYDGPDRGADTVQVGVGAEQVFNPGLLGDLRLGYEVKDFNEAKTDDADSPYFDAKITFLPSPATRLSTGLGYSLSETDVYPFTNQERFRLFGSLAHDITARVAWYLSGVYSMNSLDAEETLASAPEVEDGDEDVFQVSTRLAYRINRSNTVEAGWQIVDLSSDVREDYLRNRLHIGWKTEL